MHTILKQPIERALSSTGVGWLTRRRIVGKRLILAYHGIRPEGDPPAGERSLFIRQRDFAAHLDMLCEFADVAALDRLDEEGDGRPRIAITIDDAYRGAVREGVQELVKRGLPATLFVAPGRLDGHVFWWDAFASTNGILDPKIRDHALQILAGTEERIRAWAASENIHTSHALPESARAATRNELRSALKCPGITVGSHTWSHANLARLGASEVLTEIAHSRAWLRAEFAEKALDWLAYPYGLDSVTAHLALKDASYAGALRISGGWHDSAHVSRFARPRLNIPAGLTVAGLRARMLGAVPA